MRKLRRKINMIKKGISVNWKRRSTLSTCFAIFAGLSIFIFLFSSQHIKFVPDNMHLQTMYIFNKNSISINKDFASKSSVFIPSELKRTAIEEDNIARNKIINETSRNDTNKILTKVTNQENSTDNFSLSTGADSGTNYPFEYTVNNQQVIGVDTDRSTAILTSTLSSGNTGNNLTNQSNTVSKILENNKIIPVLDNKSNTEGSFSGNLSFSDRPICYQKKRNVAFLKVHKAGSTTVMNIFLRYAISNNLNIVLPRRWTGAGYNYIGYGKTVLRQNIIPLPSNETYNILCNHVIYNQKAFADIMPEGSTYVGIIRNPETHFKSAAVYYGFSQNLRKIINKKIEGNPSTLNTSNSLNVLSEFLKHPKFFGGVSTWYVNNRMSYDFGMNPKFFYNKKYVENYIQKLDNDFHLVMIMEYFYESLILMKRILCWDLKDIMYVPLNVNIRSHSVHLSDDDLRRLRNWNSADFELYEHFNKTFWSKVQREGPEFYDEVKYFKALQNNVTYFCQYLHKNKYLYFGKTRWNNPFIITKDECDHMVRKELPLVKELIVQAWQKYNKWVLTQINSGIANEDLPTSIDMIQLQNSINLPRIPDNNLPI